VSRFNEKITYRQVVVDKKKEISIARYSAPMVNEIGRKNPKDKALALKAFDWTVGATR
jgi:hypothetical protein